VDFQKTSRARKNEPVGLYVIRRGGWIAVDMRRERKPRILWDGGQVKGMIREMRVVIGRSKVYGMILLKLWVMLKGVLLIVSGTIDTFHTYNNGVDL